MRILQHLQPAEAAQSFGEPDFTFFAGYHKQFQGIPHLTCQIPVVI